MLPSIKEFNSMFPPYWDTMIPIWHDWDETKRTSVLSIALPGYNRKDISLNIENGDLKWNLNHKRNGKISYSIFDKFFSTQYDFRSAKIEYKKGILKIIIPKYLEMSN